MLIPKGGNNKIYTPDNLAKMIVEHYKPTGKLLEPCSGDGAFLKYMLGADWCEIDKGKDFFDHKETADWAITNPPFSQIRKFLIHLYELDVKNIVFLCPINHIIGLKARVNDMKKYGYELNEYIFIDTPKEFPQSGFQWSINWIAKFTKT